MLYSCGQVYDRSMQDSRELLLAEYRNGCICCCYERYGKVAVLWKNRIETSARLR